MLVKLFILGRPGCGKSSAARYIIDRVYNDWSAHRFKDFDILYEMFKKDKLQEQFRPSKYGGFDVLDPKVLDAALEQLNKDLTQHLAKAADNELFIIEFAREDYNDALKFFSPNVSQDAFVICIESDLETCIHRIQQRMINPIPPDDHYIAEETVRTFYTHEHFPIGDNILKRKYVVDNRGLLDDFINVIDHIADNIFKK